MNPRQTPYALNGVDQGYLLRPVYRGRCAITTSQSSLCFFVASSLGFKISSVWTSNTNFGSSMDSSFPHTLFGHKFKHAKGVDIVMGDI